MKALGVDLNQVDIAVLSHRHVDHISGFDYMLMLKPAVKAYLPADPALGAPQHFTVSHDTKESLAGLPPEQLYFGGKTNSIEYKPVSAFTAPIRTGRRELGSRAGDLSDRDSLGDDGRLPTPTRQANPDIRTLQAFPNCRWH